MKKVAVICSILFLALGAGMLYFGLRASGEWKEGLYLTDISMDLATADSREAINFPVVAVGKKLVDRMNNSDFSVALGNGDKEVPCEASVAYEMEASNYTVYMLSVTPKDTTLTDYDKVSISVGEEKRWQKAVQIHRDAVEKATEDVYVKAGYAMIGKDEYEIRYYVINRSDEEVTWKGFGNNWDSKDMSAVFYDEMEIGIENIPSMNAHKYEGQTVNIDPEHELWICITGKIKEGTWTLNSPTYVVQVQGQDVELGTDFEMVATMEEWDQEVVKNLIEEAKK